MVILESLTLTSIGNDRCYDPDRQSVSGAPGAVTDERVAGSPRGTTMSESRAAGRYTTQESGPLTFRTWSPSCCGCSGRSLCVRW